MNAGEDVKDGFAISTDVMFVLQDLTDWQSVDPNDILSSIKKDCGKRSRTMSTK